MSLRRYIEMIQEAEAVAAAAEKPDVSPHHDALVKAGYKHTGNEHGLGKNYVYRDAGKNEIRHKIDNESDALHNHRFGQAHMGKGHADVASAVKANR